VVIDHAAKPDIAGQAFQPWASQMARLARETPWCCKVSGLVTEASAAWQTDDLRRYIDHLLAEFGPARLMWGSDWPVVDLAGGYARWRQAALALLPASSHPAILGGTAARFYGLVG
jgi:L-fuconolactonase